MDFQISKYTSPVIDILYFFNTSLSDEAESRQNEILEEYHKTLCQTMTHIGCETIPFSLETLRQEMIDRAFYGMISAFTILPILVVDKSEVMSVDEMMSEEGRKSHPAFNYPRYRQILHRRLPAFDNLGLLDL